MIYLLQIRSVSLKVFSDTNESNVAFDTFASYKIS